MTPIGAAAIGLIGGWFLLKLYFLSRGVINATRHIIIPSLIDGTFNVVPAIAGTVTITLIQMSTETRIQSPVIASGVIALMGFANGYYFRGPMLSRVTPYDRYPILMRNRDSEYDVFISYKAENATVSRQIADWLVSVGRHPWFDDYVIPHVSHDHLAQSIELGIACCSHGLVMSSHAYAKAHWTRMELKGLAKRMNDETDRMTNDHLLDLQFDDPPLQFPDDDADLADVMIKRTKRFAFSGSVSTACVWLREQLGLSSIPVPPEKPTDIDWFSPDGTWQINIANWRHLETSESGDELLPGITALERIYSFQSGQDDAAVHVSIITGLAPEMWRRELSVGIIDKRTMQKQMKVFAIQSLSTQRAKLAGAHLLFLTNCPQIPQFGCTFWDGWWRRRFSIVLNDPSGRPVEFALVATFQGDFYNCCRHSFKLDWLAESLQLVPTTEPFHTEKIKQ